MKYFAILVALFLLIAPAALAQGQRADFSNPLGGDIIATSSNCSVVLSCVWQKLPSNATTITVTVSGTFTATLQFEQSGDGVNFVAASPASTAAIGTFTFTITSMTDFRVRASAYASGKASTNIQASGPNGGGGGGGSSSFTSITGGTNTNNTFIVGNGSSISTTGTGTITAGSNVNTFFTKFFGLSPQDYGAKGDVHTYGDCGLTANLFVITCTGSHFTSTALDVGKQFEMVCTAGTPNPVQGTITAFNSATSVTVSASCNATVTNQGFAFGTDDTVALQAWVAAVVVPPVKGVLPLAPSAYIPAGGYWNTKRLAFINAGTEDSGPTAGACAPGPNNTGIGIRCSLWLLGAGTDNSFFYIPSNFQWQFPSTSADVCPVLINHWDFASISNFSILAPLAGALIPNTSTNTGNVGGLCFSDNSHQNVTNLYVSGFHNTTGSLPGWIIVSDFESYYGFIASEVNDVNLFMNPLGTTPSTGILTAGNFEKIMFDTVFLENPSNVTSLGSMAILGSTLNQFRMRNIHFRSDSGTTVSLNIRNNVTIPNGDAFICDECRVTNAQGAALDIVIQSAGRYSFPELQYNNTNTTNTLATATAFDITNVAANVSMSGGNINCVGCTNAVQFGGATPSFYAMDVTLTSPTTHSAFARGGGTVNAFFRTATGWDGGGTIQSTQNISNQGAVCTNGELALSAGWQSTGSATVTAVAGTGQTCSWTITTGTTTAANPTITDTLTNVLPTATTVCEMVVNGGTHTPVVGAGTSDAFRQTTLSATAPIFTYQETPTAGGTTYFVTRRCGP